MASGGIYGLPCSFNGWPPNATECHRVPLTATASPSLSSSADRLCGRLRCPAPAWEPRNMKLLLELYEKNGARYTAPGFHSGYNEVVIGARTRNLP